MTSGYGCSLRMARCYVSYAFHKTVHQANLFINGSTSYHKHSSHIKHQGLGAHAAARSETEKAFNWLQHPWKSHLWLRKTMKSLLLPVPSSKIPSQMLNTTTPYQHQRCAEVQKALRASIDAARTPLVHWLMCPRLILHHYSSK